MDVDRAKELLDKYNSTNDTTEKLRILDTLGNMINSERLAICCKLRKNYDVVIL